MKRQVRTVALLSYFGGCLLLENFSSTWSIAGADQQVSDGTPENGHIQFTGLNSTSGILVISGTDNVRQSGLTQLSLTATPKVNNPNMAEETLPRILNMTTYLAW